ncbi:MAG: phosphatidylglycerophosphatase A family protein [Pseudobdellovibrionaceae bacterium]
MEKLAAIIATFFGVGRAPKAPGTWGTLATLPLAFALNWAGPFYIMGFILLFLPISVWASDVHSRTLGLDDPGEIVIDEVLGFLITMTWLPMTWQAFLLGFLLFRVLDIFKPFPIGYLDKKIPGGLGVMADDIAAGVIANVILQILYAKTDWLGAQIL